MKQKPEIRFRNSKFEIRNCPAVIGVVLALVGMGCGYRFSGKGGEAFPKNVQAVFVSPFVNSTRDLRIHREITSALTIEVRRGGRLRIVNRLEDADAILSGAIRSLDTRVISVNRRDEALQFEVVLIVDMSLRRRSPDELLWRDQGIRLVEHYSGSRGAVVTSSSAFKTGTLEPDDISQFTDIQLAETLGQRAREQLVKRSARDLHQRLMEMF